MLTRHRRFNISYQPHIRPFHSPFTPLSLPFISQTYMFQGAKAYLLPSKRRSFATRKTLFYDPKHIPFRSEE